MQAIKFSPYAPIYFFFCSMLCQAIGLALGFLLLDFLGGNAYFDYAPHCAMAGYAICAALLARMMKLSWPWQLFNLLLGPAIVAFAMLDFTSAFFAPLALIVFLLYLPTFWTRVPYYPTNPKMYDLIAAQLPGDRPFRFIDLGCGGGRLLAYLAARFPHGQFEGVDISPLAFFLSSLSNFPYLRKNSKISMRNFWKMDFSQYDVVYAFLAPPPMPDLWQKVKGEMKAGSLFISNTFPVPEKASEELVVDASRQGTLYLYRR